MVIQKNREGLSIINEGLTTSTIFLIYPFHRITVTNFSASLDLKLQENETNLEIKDLKFVADFENVEVSFMTN